LYLHFRLLPRGDHTDGLIEHLFTWSSVVWTLPLLFTLVSLAGLLLYRRDNDPGSVTEPMQTLIAFRIVSRGFNVATLHKTIASVRAAMKAKPLFPYVIEVVTDSAADVPLPHDDDLRHIEVPLEYGTSNGTLFKARALQYALEHSPLPDDGWIMHLDEETCVTPSFVVGIRKAVEEEELSGRHRIGAGLILYHHSLNDHPILTLAESMRSGDDIARTYLQQRLGFPVFGFHGSGLLVRNSVEKETGLDFGPGGSITEDAYFAMVQMQRGRRGRWIEGHVVEQAAFTVGDYLRQRRRWFVGITKTAMHAPVAFRYRAPMLGAMLAWALSWASVSYTYTAFVVGTSAPAPVVLLADLTLAIYVSLYLIGLKLTLEAHGAIRPLRRIRLYLAQLLLIPVFSVLESAAVAWGVLEPDAGFHVVKK
jgi:egghead protein (zeste-white 4 protein)